MTLTGLTANLPAPQLAGTPITFTATAPVEPGRTSTSGGCSTAQSWTVLQNWSASNTWTWTPRRLAATAPSASGSGSAMRAAPPIPMTTRQSNGSIAFAVGVAADAGLSRHEPDGESHRTAAVGTPITFTAAVSGGTAPQQFKWMLFDGSTTSVVQGWSTSNTWTWTPTTANAAYQVTVWARNAVEHHGRRGECELDAEPAVCDRRHAAGRRSR